MSAAAPAPSTIVTAATAAVAAQTQRPHVSLNPVTREWEILYLTPAELAAQHEAGHVVATAAELNLTEAQLDEVVEATTAFYDYNASHPVMDDYAQARSDALDMAMGYAEVVVQTAVNTFVDATLALAAAAGLVVAPAPAPAPLVIEATVPAAIEIAHQMSG
jgi:hypothetical protein